MLCEINPERRAATEEDKLDGAAGLESTWAGGDGDAAIVAISEEDVADPQDEQKRLSSETSLKHDGQRIKVFPKKISDITTGYPK
jgi:hypothetical protein